jgi:hypothetical protein
MEQLWSFDSSSRPRPIDPLSNTEGVASKALSDAARRTDGALVGHRDRACPAPLRSRGGRSAAGGRKRQLPSSINEHEGDTRDPCGMPAGGVVCECETPATRRSWICDQPTSGLVGRPSSCGDYRLQPAPGGDSRPVLVRDLCGMREKPAVERRQKIAICSYFYGATGLEPATSGVTGRSWRFRLERGLAGIRGLSRAFRWRRCGDRRV